MKVLVAPLNWGLGHASRCVPLVRRYLAQGDEVLLGGCGESLTLLRRHFPDLQVVELPLLELSYSGGDSQVGAMLRALPKIVRQSIGAHRTLRRLLRDDHLDLVVSDNLFGLWNRRVRSVYITHQLRVLMPGRRKWLEAVASWVHRQVWRHYDEVWIPDYEDPSQALGGIMSHVDYADKRLRYIGTLSRFEGCQGMEIESDYKGYDIVAVLSGLEPQRTLFEERICRLYAGGKARVLIVEGKMNCPPTRFRHGNITRVAHLDDTDLAAALLSAGWIISRSGYSSIMDLHALGVLSTKTEVVPTPGQPEQVYLALLHGSSYSCGRPIGSGDADYTYRNAIS